MPALGIPTMPMRVLTAHAPSDRRPAPQADSVLLVLDAHVDDLAEVQAHAAVLGPELVPAGASERLVERQQLLVADAHRDHLATLEADADLEMRRHQRASAPGGGRGAWSMAIPGGGGLDDLDEHAGGRGRAHEGDAGAADAAARLLVDQLEPSTLDRLERGVDVAHLIGDVVKAGAALREELAHRGVLAERRKQLDVVLADVEQRGLDALLLDDLAVDELEAELLAPQLERGLELLDGDPDVVDAVKHGRPLYPSTLVARSLKKLVANARSRTSMRSSAPCMSGEASSSV